ncbi:unnamed protein product [Sphacelaria rigidula]
MMPILKMIRPTPRAAPRNVFVEKMCNPYRSIALEYTLVDVKSPMIESCLWGTLGPVAASRAYCTCIQSDTSSNLNVFERLPDAVQSSPSKEHKNSSAHRPPPLNAKSGDDPACLVPALWGWTPLWGRR